MDTDKADMIAQFSAITGANPSMAENALGATNWNLEQSVALFYDEQAEAPDGDADEALASAASSSQSAPASATAQASGSSSAAQGPSGRGKASGRPKQMSFRDLQRGEEEDDEDDEDGKRQDMFAGGEKSGLAVQNPDRPVNHFNNIMNQARQNRERPPASGNDGDEEEEEAPARRNNFAGRAQTLGGDEAPSRVIADPLEASRGSRRPAMERVTRTLHLWQDGVSVDDGPLFAFDDPANANIMAQIQQGRAPNALLNVQPNQEVDLALEPHQGQNYVQPKKQYKPFGGQGQRLGSPTPGLSSAPAPAPAASSSSAPPVSMSAAPTEVSVDSSQPTLQMQIRLGDGTRLASRFNTSHTLGDVYDFVDRSSTASQQRAYVLQTTFPPTEFSDRTRVLGDIGDFKRGGVLVQKWK